MKTNITTWMIVFAAIVTASAAPLDTGFTYQGLITEQGKPNPGKLNFEHYYDLYNSPIGGIRVAGPVTNIVEVIDGVFTTVINFGTNVFDGTQYWLEIGLRTNSTAAFTVLAPRQSVRPTPYALHAVSAGTVGAGAIDGPALATNAVSADKIAPGQVVKSFNGLRDAVELAVAGDLSLSMVGNQILLAPVVDCRAYSNCYWNLLGNGNIVENTHFLGTIAGELAALDFRVNNNRSLRHRFTGAGSAPNITGGFFGNSVGGTGGTIGGGGRLGAVNTVLGDYGFIGGGSGNVISSAPHAAIGGGADQAIDAFSDYGFIGGGQRNIIRGATLAGTLSGGSANTIGANLYTPVIGGGAGNYVGGLISSTIAGGDFNTNQATHGAIGGGQRNFLAGISTDGSIGGGYLNQVLSPSGTIAGGRTNHIDIDSDFATISGGATNLIRFDSAFGTIGGGGSNVIDTNSPHGTIGGGQANHIDPRTSLATISGGGTNRILAPSSATTIGGGVTNQVQNTSPNATIAGGAGNVVGSAAANSTVAGGVLNRIDSISRSSAIGGGAQNSIGSNSRFGTVAGGDRNRVEADTPGVFIGGGSSNSVQVASLHATLGGGYSNLVAGSSAFATLGGGHRNLIETAAPGSTVGGGQRNSIRQNSTNSAVSGGTFNVIGFNSPASTIGGGESNVIGNLVNAVSATNATISGGRGNLIDPSAPHAVIPGGQLARATNYNQHAFASGSFSQTGDAQHSQYVLRNTSVGNAPTELFLDGVVREIVLWPNSTLSFDILVTARSGINSAGYQIQGVIKNDAGAVSFVGAPAVTTMGEDVAAWNFAVVADGGNSSLSLIATGAGATPVRWVAHVRTVEVRN